MPKAEFGTTKWMSNKIKASGLQKLRWYCQMCEKQCRDENGFKCHRMSEGHQRMMQIFIQNPTRFMDEFSENFEKEFMRLMRTRYCRTRVLANSVYNNIVADRQHVHMNSTVWVTLSEFVQYLGATKKCKIDHTPKGWYVEYIDHEEIRRLEMLQARRKEELSQEEAKARRIAELVETAKKIGKFVKPEYTSLQRKEGKERICFSATKGKKEITLTPAVNPFELFEKQLREHSRASASKKRRASNVETGVDMENHVKLPTTCDFAQEKDGQSSEQCVLMQSGAGATLKRVHTADKSSLSFLLSAEARRKPQKRLLAMERLRLEDEKRKKGAEERKVQANTAGRAVTSYAVDAEPAADGADGEAVRNCCKTTGFTEVINSEKFGTAFVEGACRSSAVVKPPPHKYSDKDWWLSEGCIVKIMDEIIGEGIFYKRKGHVLKVEQRYNCYVKMLDSDDILKFHQRVLETVIPQIGGRVRVVMGEWRDHEGVLDALEMDSYSVDVLITGGPIFKSHTSLDPVLVRGLPYEHICKILPAS